MMILNVIFNFNIKKFLGNWLIDRNFEVGFIIADQNSDKSLVCDKNWNNQNPEPFYSIDTIKTPINPLIGSAARRNSTVLQKR